MAAKKTKGSQNKSAFVRSLPASMSPKEVVVKAKAAGITLTEKYVSTIRYNAKQAAKKKSGGAPKRGPGRPRKNATGIATVASAPRASSGPNGSGGGLEAEVERIVERKVSELLRARLGSLFAS